MLRLCICQIQLPGSTWHVNTICCNWNHELRNLLAISDYELEFVFLVWPSEECIFFNWAAICIHEDLWLNWFLQCLFGLWPSVQTVVVLALLHLSDHQLISLKPITSITLTVKSLFEASGGFWKVLQLSVRPNLRSASKNMPVPPLVGG